MLRWIHWYALDMEYNANRKMISHRRRKSEVLGGSLLGISDSVAAAATASRFDACANSSVLSAEVVTSPSISHDVCLQSAFVIIKVSLSVRLRHGLSVCKKSTASLCGSDVVNGLSAPPAADDIPSRSLNPSHIHPATLQVVDVHRATEIARKTRICILPIACQLLDKIS